MKQRYHQAFDVKEVPRNKEGVQTPDATILLYAGGGCRLGNHSYAGGVPIDDEEFDACCFACRRLDEPQFLYIRESGKFGHQRIFCYVRFWRTWYEYVPQKNEKLVAEMNRIGPFRAQMRQEMRDLFHSSLVGVFSLLVQLAGAAFWLLFFLFFLPFVCCVLICIFGALEHFTGLLR